jgi:hypothetical protein
MWDYGPSARSRKCKSFRRNAVLGFNMLFVQKSNVTFVPDSPLAKFIAECKGK